MKACVIPTRKIVDIIRNSAFDKDVFYDSNGQKYNREELSFDFKGNSFLKDEPDYWTRLEHQAAITAMQGTLANANLLFSLCKDRDDCPVKVVAIEFANACAHALVEKMKEEK